jgi:hypothetical protein
MGANITILCRAQSAEGFAGRAASTDVHRASSTWTGRGTAIRACRAIIVALALGNAAAAAQADEGNAKFFSLTGFGTLGAVYHGSDGVEFRRDISEPNGAAAHRWNFSQDSMLGVQASARPSTNVEATLQLVSRNGIGVGYQPQVTWAYVKLKPVEELSLRAGRLGIEMYMEGDSAEIGYANLLVRQPVIFYPRTFDGVDAEWVRPVADGNVRLKAQFGKATGKLMSDAEVQDIQGSRGRTLLAEYSRHGWTGRVSAARLILANEISGANFDALRSGLALAPNGAAIIDTISMKDRPVTVACAALAYDGEPFVVTASLSRTSSPNWADTQEFYTQVGYRLGKMTPYGAYSQHRSNRNFVATGLPWGLSPAIDALNQGAALAQASLKTNQSDWVLGVRIDTSRNTALKLQLDRINYQDPDAIVDPSLSAIPVEQRGFKRLDLFSAALEFVF